MNADTIADSIVAAALISTALITILAVAAIAAHSSAKRTHNRRTDLAAPSSSSEAVRAYHRDTGCQVNFCEQPWTLTNGRDKLCAGHYRELSAGWDREQLPYDQDAVTLVDEAEAWLRGQTA